MGKRRVNEIMISYSHSSDNKSLWKRCLKSQISVTPFKHIMTSTYLELSLCKLLWAKSGFWMNKLCLEGGFLKQLPLHWLCHQSLVKVIYCIFSLNKPNLVGTKITNYRTVFINMFTFKICVLGKSHLQLLKIIILYITM